MIFDPGVRHSRGAGLTRFLSSLLFGVGARDPIAFVALPLGLLLVAVLATLIPAARVVRVNPVVALRGE